MDSKGAVIEVATAGEELNCPYCGGRRQYRHGAYLPEEYFVAGATAKKVYLELYRQGWQCRQ